VKNRFQNSPFKCNLQRYTEVTIPFWALVYAPILVTLSTVCFTPNGGEHFDP
jgi:hypothetical protein